MKPTLPRGLYGMACTTRGDPVLQGLRLAALGVGVVQLRAKGWGTAERVAAARALLPALQAHGCLLIINDDLEAAAESGANGLHLGQGDGSLAWARARLGPDALLGRSTHTLEQVLAAPQEGADYIGFGPVFGTHSKQSAWSPRGLERLAEAVRASPLPVVAIGGVTVERLPALRATGVAAWAAISAIDVGNGMEDSVRDLSPNP
jgi:thiamine-phosphate pyrophosphorylase